jgi:hypothetical protein
MPGPDPVSIFFLYAPEDEELRQKLEKHLIMLKHKGLVSGWSDRMVSPGAEWRTEIERRLNEAQIILVLISADFLASEAYDEEMQRALKRHHEGKARVIPVLARPVDWSMGPFHDPSPVNDLPLTSHEDLDAALAEVAATISRYVKTLPTNPRVAHRPHAPSR